MFINPSTIKQIDPTISKDYAAVGKCIYCSNVTDQDSLTKEHIVPYGLNGNVILPKASCRACAKITGTEVEQPCLRRMLGPFRIVQNLQTRNRKERPETLSVTFQSQAGVEHFEVPSHLYHAFTVLSCFPPPTILLDLVPPPGHVMRAVKVWHISKDQRALWQHTKQEPGKALLHMRYSSNNRLFLRMVAKIAHSYAVAEYGMGKFNPLVIGQILGTEPWRSGYLVGGHPHPVAPTPHLHFLSLQQYQTKKGRTLLTCLVRLFSRFGAPIYHVVVGEL